MAGFDEQIVREYFELHGFLIRQQRKYQVQSRPKLAEEEIDFLVYNPSWSRGQRQPNFLLFATELPLIHRAVVAVKPWHTTQRFTPKLLRSSSAIFSFLEKSVLRSTEGLFAEEDDGNPAQGKPPLMKILVLPGLPTAEPHRSESIQLLRDKGVDAIISFRSMLIDIINKVETNRNYQKSDTLQILRVLKNYDLLKDPQMDLFS